MSMVLTAESKPPPSVDIPKNEGLNRPGIVAGLWMILTFLYVADQIRFPDPEHSVLVSSILFLSAIPVFAALIAARITALGHRALALAATILLVACAVELLWLPAQWALERGGMESAAIGALVGLAGMITSATLVFRAARHQGTTTRRSCGAALATLFSLGALPAVGEFDDRLMTLSAQVAPQSETEDEFPTSINQEQLWLAQPSLVAASLDKLGARHAAGETYVVTVGASGSQSLFGREAREAGAVLGQAFKAGQRSSLLANDRDSLNKLPLASTTNLDSFLFGLGRKLDPSRDLVVIYLTSHGSRNAELTTNLPDYSELKSISANSLADALRRSGIRRRVIIVSACYAGSWIKPLASDDTIILTAARSDRTSFGCSDDRQLTYFGEALLKGPLANGSSLADGFVAARKKVAGWEGDSLHSEPQAYVGRNMTNIWNARLSGTVHSK